MAPLRDDGPYTAGSSSSSSRRAPPPPELNIYTDMEAEKSLLDPSGRQSLSIESEEDGIDIHRQIADEEGDKEERIRGYQSTGRKSTRQQIATFFVLVLLILAVIFSQLFIETPPEAIKGVHGQGASGSSGGSNAAPANVWPPPPRPPAPQDYVIAPDWDYAAPPRRREYYWTIQDVTKHPDGVYRQMMLINGQYPGPMIEINEGDTIVVHVANRAQNATSVHWHGIYQNGSNWMDGTVGITQCPIAPGGNFTYEFTVDQQCGTYYYHAHHGVQAADGLFGPLVVHSRNEEWLSGETYASDRVVMVSDHYYETSNSLLMKYLASDNENAEPTPDTGLINGRGTRDCSLYPEYPCDNSSTHLPQFNLLPNQRHRLRLVNVGQFAEFQISIDQHPFTIMEVDGTVVRSVEYDRLNINPAQRYSILVDTKATERDAFWLRAKMLTKCFVDPDPRMNAEARAVIKYGNMNELIVDPEEVVSTDSTTGPDLVCRDMDVSELVPLPVIEAPQPDAIFYLRTNFEIGAWRLSRGKFNQTSWRADVQSPSLHRILDGLHAQNASFISSSSSHLNDVAFDTGRELVIQTNAYQVIDLMVSNFDDGNHPLHLHGYKFFVLAQGHGYPPADLYDTMDLTNPMRRDTASVEGFGWTLLRLIADNPGAWALHCHVSWHAEAGLLMQLVTRADLLETMAAPRHNLDLCAAPLDQLRLGGTPADDVFMGHVMPVEPPTELPQEQPQEDAELPQENGDVPGEADLSTELPVEASTATPAEPSAEPSAVQGKL